MANWTKEYTAAADFTTAPAGGAAALLPCWIEVVGSGTLAVTNEDGSTGTFTCVGGEKIAGVFRAITTCTVTRVRVGTSALGAKTGTSGPAGANGTNGTNGAAGGGAGVPAAPSGAGKYSLNVSAGGVVSWIIDTD